jgi:hypothetical protein
MRSVAKMEKVQQLTVLDPSTGPVVPEKKLAPRLTSLDGKVLAVINNGKINSDAFLQSVVDGIRELHTLSDVIWIDKPNASMPAGAEILEQLKSAHAVVAGVGD